MFSMWWKWRWTWSSLLTVIYPMDLHEKSEESLLKEHVMPIKCCEMPMLYAMLLR